MITYLFQTSNIFMMSLTVDPQTVQCEISFIWAHLIQAILCLHGKNKPFLEVVLHIVQ